ncbi:hypothetical protein [Escherichia coli]|uniref:hypothetical protein n=1 Tax=Escherichia coli TaxID=562 RepID=UPI002E12969C
MSTHTFTKHLHEIIFYTPHGCETTTGAFLSEVSPITTKYRRKGNDSNLLIVFYVQIMPDDFVMQLHRF